PGPLRSASTIEPFGSILRESSLPLRFKSEDDARIALNGLSRSNPARVSWAEAKTALDASTAMILKKTDFILNNLSRLIYPSPKPVEASGWDRSPSAKVAVAESGKVYLCRGSQY